MSEGTPTPSTVPAQPIAAPAPAPAPARPALGIIRNEPADIYHATKAISFHRLMDFDWQAGGTPALYHWKHILGNRGEETKALKDGRAIHTLVLEGEEAFRQRYRVLDPAIKGNSKEAREAKALAASAGDTRETVKADDYELFQRIRQSVHHNDTCRRILSSGEPEVVARREVVPGLYKQVRFDWLDEPNLSGADLKTYGDRLEWFGEEAIRRFYDRQVTFYARTYLEVAYESGVLNQDHVVDFAKRLVLIACEKEPSWRTQPFRFDDSSLKVADSLNQIATDQLICAHMENAWPDGSTNEILTLTTRRAAPGMP